jgi:acetylornithine deacetylase/succinyl-diaminopimelate desuccinylase-like protein
LKRIPRSLVAALALPMAGAFALVAQRASGAASPQPSGRDTTAALLVDLLRVDTSNPPGNEAGIARLKGSGRKRPILIAAHADVVGVEREKWTVDPFAGVIRDGYVLGRGAIDFKGGMAVFARAAMMLAERKVPLDRDVILLAEADEEGGRYNTNWLAREHWAKIDCEFALNEGGWIIKGSNGRVRYVSISTADKSSVPIVVAATGTSTHASMPRPDNAIFALSRALAKISAYETEITLIPSTRRFFSTLAKTSRSPQSGYFMDLVGSDTGRARRAAKEIGRDPLLNALMRTTLAPVMMNAGFRGNVIPGSATATINVRLIPGTRPADVVRELQRVIDDPSIEVRLSNPNAGPNSPPPSPEDTELYRALERSARQQFSAEVTPYLFQAGTDAGAWRSRGIPVYGIYPYPVDADDLARMHGNDERVSIESLRQGTEMIYRTLVDVAGRTR